MNKATTSEGRARTPSAPQDGSRNGRHGVASLPRRKRLKHTPPAWVRTDEAVFFITICCEPKGENQLCRPDVSAQIFESVAYRHRRGDWWVQICVLMPDHVHMVVSFPERTAGTACPPYQGRDATGVGRDATPWRPQGGNNDDSARTASAPYPEQGRDATPWRPAPTMQSVITAWKHYAATQFGIRWQRDFFDHRLRGEESAREKEDYIGNNPVRAGLVARKEDWPYVWRA